MIAPRLVGFGSRSRSLPGALLLVLCLALAPPAPAAAQEREPLFDATDALFAGAFVLGTVAMAPLDVHLAGVLQDPLRQENRVLRFGARGFELVGFPGVVLITGGMYAAGKALDRDRLADAGVHATEAIVAGQVVNFAVKTLVGRARPFLDTRNPFNFGLLRGAEGDQYQSFPSGHTAAAFATAAALAHEIAVDHPDARLLTGSLLYGGAALVGVSRMYHNRHWASDVVMGAAVGSFAGWKVVRYTHSHPENRVDGWLLSVSLPPDLRGAARVAVLPILR